MEEENCNVECDKPQYIGVRKRKWGKWVTEIRRPGQKTRIWLGSYEAPEMAAAAYDVAALHLRGPKVQLNFPELIDNFPKPVSFKAEDIQAAAQEAAMTLKMRGQRPEEGGPPSIVPVRVGLSASQIQAINDCPLDSPEMWMGYDYGASLLGGMEITYGGIETEELEEMDYYPIWDWLK